MNGYVARKDNHLHAFAAGEVTYDVPYPDGDTGWGRRTVDERTVTLGQVLDEPKAKLRWDYDIGDNWQHDVVVESTGPTEADFSGPVCVAGRRACPPEDSCGTWGYANLLAALADPDHEDQEELTEWAPPGFDPAAFDPPTPPKPCAHPRRGRRAHRRALCPHREPQPHRSHERIRAPRPARPSHRARAHRPSLHDRLVV